MTEEAHERTVAAYEAYAEEYARIVGSDPAPGSLAGMEQLLDRLPAGAYLLEVGSGTGRDADHLEARAVTVRRTDVTEAFLRQQRERGHRAERLDVLSDDLGGPYDAVVALATLIHVPRDRLGDVLAKVAGSLVDGGLALVSMREGDGIEPGRDAYTALWRRDDLERAYADVGLAVEWHLAHAGRGDDRWNVHLLRRAEQGATD